MKGNSNINRGLRFRNKDNLRFSNHDNNPGRMFSNKRTLRLKENPKKGKRKKGRKKNRIETRMSKVHPTIKLLRGLFCGFQGRLQARLRDRS